VKPAAGSGRLAPAKINLALHVTGRRPDGYHDLDTLAVFADIGDRVTIAPGRGITLSLGGPFAAHAPGDPSDLAYRAAEAFFAAAGLTPAAAIRVEKNLPAGAGLGGGSSDAAAVLAGLDAQFGTGLPLDRLIAIGTPLGADVPMCLVGNALRARGIGEAVARIGGWPPLPLVLVWPGRPVPTAEVFKALVRRENPPLPDPPAARSPAAVAAWLEDCRNDLEDPAMARAPEIGRVLAALRRTEDCLLARMSGSGSACFGLYPDPEAARRAALVVADEYPGWWSVAATAR
jgi:4-diphosphocytidyl-2-C-methyl-D-erythritol kinase